MSLVFVVNAATSNIHPLGSPPSLFELRRTSRLFTGKVDRPAAAYARVAPASRAFRARQLMPGNQHATTPRQ